MRFFGCVCCYSIVELVFLQIKKTTDTRTLFLLDLVDKLLLDQAYTLGLEALVLLCRSCSVNRLLSCKPGVAPPTGYNPTGNQSPSNPGAPEVPPQSVVYVSPPGQSQPHGGTAGNSEVGVPLAAYRPIYDPANEGYPSWPQQPAGGFQASFDPSSWMPSRSFPDFGVWSSEDADGVTQQSNSRETARLPPPLPPSSYIIQSRNGYWRATEDLSHMKYVPEYPEPQVTNYEVVETPQHSAPVAKG
ncbi:uncharacterized protein [Labrus bergylta]|uniref:uncharacterized protein n=1 Tax=Labrus bergylta TaxID=56723 RepID=UPI0033136E7E